MHLGASTRIIPCSGGQYVSFGTPHAYLNTTFQNLKFSKNQKRAWLFLYFCQSGGGSKYVFWAQGDNTLLLVPHKPIVEQFFQKIVFRQISQISTFSPFGRNSWIWEFQRVLFLVQGANTLLLVLHMPTLKQSFKISNFRKIKKGRGLFGMFTNV